MGTTQPIGADYILVTCKNRTWLFWDKITWVTDIDTAVGYSTYGEAAQALYTIPDELIINNTTTGMREIVRAAIQEIEDETR